MVVVPRSEIVQADAAVQPLPAVQVIVRGGATYTTSGAERINRKWFKSARQEIKDGINRDDDGYAIATLYAETGENEKALELLERAYARHDSELLQLKVDPRMDNLRSSPRFQDLLRRMNFPEQ